MSCLTLNHPVHTLDNQLLLSPGVELTPESLEGLIEAGKGTSLETRPLLQYGSVREHLLEFLRLHHYRVIFPGHIISSLLEDMERVVLPVPVLESFEYFREHDYYTYRHSLMVFALSTLLAKDLLPDSRARVRLAATGPTHDMGKMCVPLEILKKSSPLTREEHDFLDHHAKAGYALLSWYFQDARHLAPTVARDHHERRDGSGHPRGTQQRDLLTEIIAVCDIYDALISPRPYRPTSYDNRTALEELTTMAEKGVIGWDVVKALVSHNRKVKVLFSECEISGEKRGKPPEGNVYGVISEEEEEAGKEDDSP
jgi:HD-GYP domain-containing protein (c-di-GMP phosphodiesterase class II)